MISFSKITQETRQYLTVYLVVFGRKVYNYWKLTTLWKWLKLLKNSCRDNTGYTIRNMEVRKVRSQAREACNAMYNPK